MMTLTKHYAILRIVPCIGMVRPRLDVVADSRIRTTEIALAIVLVNHRFTPRLVLLRPPTNLVISGLVRLTEISERNLRQLLDDSHLLLDTVLEPVEFLRFVQ